MIGYDSCALNDKWFEFIKFVFVSIYELFYQFMIAVKISHQNNKQPQQPLNIDRIEFQKSVKRLEQVCVLATLARVFLQSG